MSELNLTAAEIKVLNACIENTGNNGGDFGFAKEVVNEGIEGMTAKRLRQVIVDLNKKGAFDCFEKIDSYPEGGEQFVVSDEARRVRDLTSGTTIELSKSDLQAERESVAKNVELTTAGEVLKACLGTEIKCVFIGTTVTGDDHCYIRTSKNAIVQMTRDMNADDKFLATIRDDERDALYIN